MRLIFLSTDNAQTNREIDGVIRHFFDAKTRITYIPSCSFGCEPYFQNFSRYFRRFGVTKHTFLPPDRPSSKKLLREAFASDAIFLSGGNTFGFLKSLRQNSLIEPLEDFARKDRVMIGVSAGSIIMTPKITTASIPSFAADENFAGLKSLNSLGLVDFEFSPHASFSKPYRTEMMAYSKKSKLPLYSCADGGGVVVDGSKMTVIGAAECFFAGSRVFSIEKARRRS